MEKPTVGSLFSGVGGFDLGLERAGMTCKWQVENNKACNGVLGHHWPDVKRYGDIREVSGLEAVDVVTGGFPCQDLSVAGKRKGLAGERSGLWFEFHRVLAELTPQWVVIENVPGLLSSNEGRDFAIILQGLAEIGYLSAWRVLDAQYYGVAQRRRRVFIVGSLGDGRAAEVLFEPESLSWDTAPSRQAGEGVAAPVKASSPSRRGGGSWPVAEEFVVAPTLDASMNEKFGSNQWVDNKQFVIARSITTREGQRRNPTTETVLPITFNWQSGGDVRLGISEEKTGALQANQIPAVAFAQNTRDELRLISGDGQITGALSAQPGMKQQTFLAGYGVRRLTPTECERLQGFPDGWTAVNGQKDTARYRQLGNAVFVPGAEWIARQILAVSGSRESMALSGKL